LNLSLYDADAYDHNVVTTAVTSKEIHVSYLYPLDAVINWRAKALALIMVAF